MFKSAESVSVVFEKYLIPFGMFIFLIGLYVFPSRDAYRTSVSLTFGLPCLFYLAVYGRRLAKNYFSNSALLFFLSSMFLIALSSLWGGGGGGEITDSFQRFFSVALFGFGVFVCVSKQALLYKRLLVFSVLLVSAISLVWIIDYYLIGNMPFDKRFLYSVVSSIGIYEPGQYAGFYNPLLFGHVQGFFCVVALMIMFWEVKGVKRRFFLGVFMSPMFILLFLAQARTAIGSVFVVLLCCMILKGRSSNRAKLIGGGLLVFLSVMMIVLWDFLSVRGLSYRPYIWGQSWEMIQYAFWFGHGLGAEIQIESPIIKGFFWNDTHNLFLAIWYYSGFFAIVLMCAFFVMVLVNSNVDGLASPWFWAMLCYLLVENMTDGGGLMVRPNEHWFAWYLPCLFISAYSQVARQEINNGFYPATRDGLMKS